MDNLPLEQQHQLLEAMFSITNHTRIHNYGLPLDVLLLDHLKVISLSCAADILKQAAERTDLTALRIAKEIERGVVRLGEDLPGSILACPLCGVNVLTDPEQFRLMDREQSAGCSLVVRCCCNGAIAITRNQNRSHFNMANVGVYQAAWTTPHAPPVYFAPTELGTVHGQYDTAKDILAMQCLLLGTHSEGLNARDFDRFYRLPPQVTHQIACVARGLRDNGSSGEDISRTIHDQAAMRGKWDATSAFRDYLHCLACGHRVELHGGNLPDGRTAKEGSHSCVVVRSHDQTPPPIARSQHTDITVHYQAWVSESRVQRAATYVLTRPLPARGA